jgi:pyridoxamine 5'-phosphate oxidase
MLTTSRSRSDEDSIGPDDTMTTPDPVRLFRELLDQAIAAGITEPTAMTLATVGSDCRPSTRMVLLKEVDERGFVFYTNLGSRKARELREHPYAALCFFWQPLGKQVRIEGKAEQVDDDEADAYFASRPRGSQLGAWVSRQSEPLANRDELIEQLRRLEERFAGEEIPRPAFWSGFRIIPERMEFWTAGEFRLHERVMYERGTNTEWASYLLYP